VQLLCDYGVAKRSRGADSWFFDHAARRRAKKALGKDAFRGIEKLMNTYMVVANDGTIITVAWRIRRLRS